MQLTTSNDRVPKLNKPRTFDREFRLGLVLYGGISLAIYMNGICQEFYNAVRGRGIYKLVKALTNSDIVVDIVSGTSAGGINGVLLSYALANSDESNIVDFQQFAQIWRNSGDIDKLLREPARGKSTSEVNSFLDGEEYYQGEFEKAFRQAGNYRESAPKNEWYSDFRELDLYLTGTDLLGRIYKIFDNTGKVIDIKDHRTVFHLKYREDRKQWIGNPFKLEDEGNYQALAKLCRITSCFPVAFPVVTVKLEPNFAYSDYEADKKLVEWGELNKRILPPRELTEHGHQLYFVDGGVLENRPFRHTISAIDRRTAYNPVDRKLFYIDPNPDVFVGSPEFNQMPKPDIWRVATNSLINLPSYQSIGKDVESIKEYNEKINKYRSLRQDIEKDFETKNGLYKLEEKIHQNLDKFTDNHYNHYWHCRFFGLFNRLLPIMLDIGKYQGNDKNQKFLEQVAQQLNEELNKNVCAEKSKKFFETVKKIKNLDLQYAYRKYCFFVYKTSQIIQNNDELTNNEIKELRCLKYKLTWQIELIKVIQESLDEILSKLNLEEIIVKDRNYSQLKFGEIYSFLIVFHQTLLNENLGQKLKREETSAIVSFQEFLNKEEIDYYLNQIKEIDSYFNEIKEIDSKNFEANKINKASEIFNRIYDIPICRIHKNKANGENIAEIKIIKHLINQNLNNIREENKQSILSRIDEEVKKIIFDLKVSQNVKDLLVKFNHNFKEVDAFLYPYEYLTNLEGKSKIELVRISPEDANLGYGKGKGLNDKLAGDQFRAFGGFFKKSWRSNDLLWGRLDGLNRLIEALVTQESVKYFKDFVERESINQKVTEEKYIELLVKKCIQGKHNQEITEGLIELFKLLKDIDAEKQKDNNAKELKELQEFLDSLLNRLLNKLVEEGQREIISTDLIQVIGDDIDQRKQWSDKKANSMWTPTKLAEESLTKPTSDYKEDYFRNLYRVGQEKLDKDVPLSVRSRWLSKSVLIFRDILVSWQGEKINKNPIYVLCDVGLSVYHRLKPSNRVLNLSLLVMVGLFLVFSWKLLLVAKAKFFAIAIFIIILVILALLLLKLLLKLIAYLFSLILGD
jgi:patatin-related protein